jgi:hypothetical protein
MNFKYFKALVCTGTLVALGSEGAWADTTIYYDANPVISGGTNVTFQMANGQEVGNEVTVAPGSTFSMTSFGIEYYSPSTDLALANVGVDIRFYLNNGASSGSYTNPGSLFYDSTWIYGILTGGAQSLQAQLSDLVSGWNTNVVANYLIPGDFTFTITFTNLDGGSVIDMPLAYSTTSGNYTTSYGDYWVNNNGTWQLDTNSVPANFIVDITGTVPEPSTYGLTIVGGALLLGINKLRRKR